MTDERDKETGRSVEMKLALFALAGYPAFWVSPKLADGRDLAHVAGEADARRGFLCDAGPAPNVPYGLARPGLLLCPSCFAKLCNYARGAGTTPGIELARALLEQVGWDPQTLVVPSIYRVGGPGRHER